MSKFRCSRCSINRRKLPAGAIHRVVLTAPRPDGEGRWPYRCLDCGNRDRSKRPELETRRPAGGVEKREEFHHVNTRRWTCPCGLYHEWPNRPEHTYAGRAVGHSKGGRFSHTRPWTVCACGTVHLRGNLGQAEFLTAQGVRGTR